MGEKLKLFVIGKYINPKALKGANRENMPVRYAGQKNAWMTRFIERYGGLIPRLLITTRTEK